METMFLFSDNNILCVLYAEVEFIISKLYLFSIKNFFRCFGTFIRLFPVPNKTRSKEKFFRTKNKLSNTLSSKIFIGLTKVLISLLKKNIKLKYFFLFITT